MMTVQPIDQTPEQVIRRIDAIITELQTLRHSVSQIVRLAQPDSRVATNAVNIVDELAGSLGPAAPDELDYFNTFDLSWQRFAE